MKISRSGKILIVFLLVATIIVISIIVVTLFKKSNLNQGGPEKEITLEQKLNRNIEIVIE